MVLVVEDGTGLANADTFCTLQFVKDYHAALGFTWVASDANTETAMRRAVAYMVQKWGGRWLGNQNLATQALPWPRSNAWSPEGFSFDSDSVPLPVKQMEAELTLSALEEDLMPNQSNPGTVSSKSVTVGPISKSTTWIGGQSFQKAYSKVNALARQVSLGSSQVQRTA